MKFLLTNKLSFQIPLSSDPEIREGKTNFWKFYFTGDSEEKTSDKFYSFIDGYIRDFEQPKKDTKLQLESCLKHISNQWPVSDHITGSFSGVLLRRSSEQLILFTDPIGTYPLYYREHEGSFYVSNSIIWMGRATGAEADDTGIFQRSFGPEYCNLGRRTILKNCKRLLPGEHLCFNSKGLLEDCSYDNSLYENVSKVESLDIEVQDYWKSFKKELDFCLASENPKINIALSGGMDSRLLLGAIPLEKDITAFTYGDDRNYETRIAKRLAKKRGAQFRNFHDFSLNFPPLEIMEKYTAMTEAVYLCTWLEILENVKQSDEVLLIGDLSTAITGRTIKRFSSKAYQKENFLNHNFFGKDYDFEANKKESFESWRCSIKKKFFRVYNEQNIKNLGLAINLEDLKNESLADLNLIFERIGAHELPYIELVDELFTWYTHTRFPMGKQVLINQAKFQAYCPSLSTQVMRMASNIHPAHRLNLKFVRRLFDKIIDLKDLGKIPTSQVPMLPLNFPHLIRIPVWGMRKLIDEMLIKRLMKNKNPEKRYRLFRGNNWVEAYQVENLESILESYFDQSFLGKGYVENIKNKALKRRELEQWPFANMNIINAAALNTELRMIFHYKEFDEI